MADVADRRGLQLALVLLVTFKYRGPNTFYFKRKRRPIDCLRGQMACRRTCSGGGGGTFDAKTGEGEAWSKVSDRFPGWFRHRAIKAGQWAGPWVRVRNDDI